MKSKSRITKQDETMQASVRFMLAGFLCFLLAPLSSSEAQENDKLGPWGEWTPCSRTCGVGVSYQDRECLEKEKPEDYCKGNDRIRRRTCNIQDCPEGSRDFRLEQCEAYNNRTVDGQKYKWMPYIPSHERCALNCMPKGKFFYFQWADKVVDGTRCSVDSYDICVDGKCEKLGCDLILNSNAKEDKCRVCNGNGETCKTHKGVNTEDGDGYKEIVVIPASATNIDIQEIAPSSNFLALSDSSRSYFFNGDYVIENPKKLLIAGTVFNYERTRFDQERIYSLGPTSIPVHVEVLFLGEKNPGISYEFSVPKSVTKLPERAQFSWRTGEFDKCSATCAGGEQKRRVYCVRDDSGEEVSKSNCDDNEKPSHKQKCNPQPCPASWFISAWSTCSLTCGRGKMVRRVHCEHIVEGGDAEMIPDEQCPDPKPITMRICQMQKSCPEWSESEWSKCNVSCGHGFKHRNVTCQTLDTKETLQPERCNPAFRPSDKEQCNPGPCTVTWMASNWSECYPKCGKGMSTRMVYCVSISDKSQKYPDDLCDKASRPINEKNCLSDDLCPPMWHASQWSKCTATCGVGMQMRNVMCGQRVGPKMLSILSSDQCKKEKKMNGMQKCSVKPCQAGWYIYPWEPCSKTCGLGVRRRSVKCFADSKEDPEEKWCKAEHKPVTEEECIMEECKVPTTASTTPTQTTAAVTTKQTTPSTAKPSTTTAAEVTTAAVQERTTKPAITTGTEEESITTMTTAVPTITKESTTTESEEVTTVPEETETSTVTTITQKITTKVTEEDETSTATTVTQEITTEVAEKETTTDQGTTTEAAEQTTTESTTTEADTEVTTEPDEETTTATTITQETTATTDQDTTTEAAEQTTKESATTEADTEVTTEPDEETTTAATITQETTATTDQEPTTEAAEQTTTKVSATTEIDTEVTTEPEEETTFATTITQETTATTTDQEVTTEAVEQTTTESTTELVTTAPEEETSTATTITQGTTADQETTTEAVKQTTTKESATTEIDTEVTTEPEEKETSTATSVTQETTTRAEQETTTEEVEQTTTTTVPATTKTSTTTEAVTEEKETTAATTITEEAKTATKEETTTVQDTTTETAEQTTTSPTQTEETATSQASSTITSETSSTTMGTTTAETSTTTPPPTTTASATTTPPPTTTAPASTTPEITTEPPTTARRIIPAKITDPPEDTMAYVGAEVLFRCRATGYPEPLITWRKGPIPVSSLDSSRIQILSNGDLRITDITKDNDDTYTCIATNFVGPMDSRRARLDVIVPVSVSMSPTNTTAQPGDNVKITCTSEGVPEPEVEWYKNGDLLNSQGRVRVTRTEVVISQVQASDSGYYKCRAHHNYGGASDRMFLNVMRKEEPTTPPLIEKCEDSPAIAHCSIVRQVNFCCTTIYKKACCKTCKDLFHTCDLQR